MAAELENQQAIQNPEKLSGKHEWNARNSKINSITCEDGRSMLPSSVGFGSPVVSRGGAADVGGGVRRSKGVVGDLVEVWSRSVALLPAL